MKILMLNRRDIRNPHGGGAEVYTHEMAKGIVEHGGEVTVFSSIFNGAPAREEVDGVRYVRRGNELTVHLWGFFHARKNRESYDLIVDQFNGIGFFGFFFPNSVLLIYQMYKEFWFRELGVPGVIPYLMEPLFLRLYRNKPAITISASTEVDLHALGFRDIFIVPVALHGCPAEEMAIKESHPTLLFLGRLRSTKRPEDAIQIYRSVKAVLPDAKLWFAGRGPDEERLRRMAGDDPDIIFWGYVDEGRKCTLLRRAHLLIVPGVREGFGINVIEAASQGTPAVGYDVPGLRDSIRDGRTGLLAEGAGDAALKALGLLKDPVRYARMASACLEYSRGFSWERRAEEFWRLVLRFAST